MCPDYQGSGYTDNEFDERTHLSIICAAWHNFVNMGNLGNLLDLFDIIFRMLQGLPSGL